MLHIVTNYSNKDKTPLKLGKYSKYMNLHFSIDRTKIILKSVTGLNDTTKSMRPYIKAIKILNDDIHKFYNIDNND